MIIAVQSFRRCENMVGESMLLASFNKFNHGLCKSCGVECFEGIVLEPCLLQPCFHVAGLPIPAYLFQLTRFRSTELQAQRVDMELGPWNFRSFAPNWGAFARRPQPRPSWVALLTYTNSNNNCTNNSNNKYHTNI